MDHDKMVEGIRLFLAGVGRRFEGDDLERTPERVARAWREDLIRGYGTEPLDEVGWTPAPAGAGPVLVRGISFASICVHHLLPFFGSAAIAYLPADRLAGLSKIGRVIESHARRLQTQEHLTSAIVGTLEQALEPRGVLAVLEAEHTCMTLRGVRKERSRMVTVGAAGIYDADPAARGEMLRLLGRGDGER